MAALRYGYPDERFEGVVSSRFHCTICLNVFKDPVMCRRNQHIFCRGCITRSLASNQTCPVCKDPLTLDTLRVAPRVLTDYLSELKIRCDFFNRGCLQFVQLEHLERHVADCGFAPEICSNEGCQLEINRNDIDYHEIVVCEKRVKCHNCQHIRQEICGIQYRLDDIERKVEETSDNVYSLFDKITELNSFETRNIQAVNAKLCSIDSKLNCLEENERRMQEHNREIKDSLTRMIEPLAKMSRIETEQDSNEKTYRAANSKTSEEMCNGTVFVAGGCAFGQRLSSLEKYNMLNRTWTIDSSSGAYFCRASSVLYCNQMFVTGGEKSFCNGVYFGTNSLVTDDILRMNIDIPTMSLSSRKFVNFPVKLPRKLSGHSSVVYNDLMYVLGGRDERGTISADIHQIQLLPPYDCKLVATLPEGRWNHSVQLFGDKILCFGGEVRVGSSVAFSTSASCVIGSISRESVCNTNSVLEYDITNKVCKQLGPLSCAVSEAATVKFGDNVIVVGGVGSSGNPLAACFMYNVKTQLCDRFPCLNEARRGCTAVFAGDYIMVMGGERVEHRKKGKVSKVALSSVEEFCFERYSWNVICPMNKARYLATAIVY